MFSKPIIPNKIVIKNSETIFYSMISSHLIADIDWLWVSIVVGVQRPVLSSNASNEKSVNNLL